MKKVITVGALLIAACRYGTATPGLERCTTTFYLVGYYRDCERGPSWEEVARHDPELFRELVRRRTAEVVTEKPIPAPMVPAPVAPKPAPAIASSPGWWCTAHPSGAGSCARDKAECETYRAANAGFAACTHQPAASCHAMSGCFTTEAACERYEREASRSGLGCETR